MDLKHLGVTKLMPLVRAGYNRPINNPLIGHQISWWLDNTIKRWIRATCPTATENENKDLHEAANLFVQWVGNSHCEAETWLVLKSPSMAAKLAISHKKRLSPENEKILLEKAKDKVGLLEYCTHFGIIMNDLTKVTMKAAFGENSRREKAYVRKMEDTKRNLKGFLSQLINAGQIDPTQTVEDLLKNL